MTAAVVNSTIEISSMQELDFQQFALKMGTKTKNGQTAYPSIAGETIRVNLTPDEWLHSPWGFDFTGRFETPSFLGGKSPERDGTPESLKITLTLDNKQAEFLQKLDDASRVAFAEINPAAKWTPLVKYESYMTTKVAVVLKGDGLTKMAVVQENKVDRGEGYDFLSSFKKTFAMSQVKLVIRVKKLWLVGGGAGLSLEATQLVLKDSRKPVEAVVFDNDQDLIA